MKLVRGLSEQIVEQLRDDIFSGRISPGEHLVETELAKKFSVSRGPVRDAIRQLSWEGVVDIGCNKGAIVSSPPPDEITELLVPIRRTLEKFAVRSFFDHLTESDFKEWDEILEKIRKACENNDINLTAEYDLAFHRSLVTRSQSADLIAIWSSIVSRVREHFKVTHANYKNLINVYKEHVAVVDALRCGELNKALDAMEKHIC